jgi:Na+/pantothenate symporter
MDGNILYTAIELVILIGAFLVGKFIIPKFSSKDAVIFNTILKWIEAFVISAKNLMSNASGEEKKAAVTEQVKKLLAEYKVNLTDEQISALIEKAYDTVIGAVPTPAKEVSETKTE